MRYTRRMSSSLNVETPASPAPATRLGVLGLGAMGAPMAQNLLAARSHLVVQARSPRPDLVAAGATWTDTPRELAAATDAILVMLPDLPELEAALDGPDGLLAGIPDGGGLLLMIGSTSSPTGVRALAERLASVPGRRIEVVDCPVSGGVDGAAAGTLSIMIGGDEDAAARAAALLAPCGTPVRLGPLGAGEVAKACNQLVVAATITALGRRVSSLPAPASTSTPCGRSWAADTPDPTSSRAARTASSPATTPPRAPRNTW